MFGIVREPIVGPLLSVEVASGGLVVFEGLVRITNEGRQVEALEYEAFDELAVSEGERILEEARARFPIDSVSCVHRVGMLALGEVAIRVEVASGHRREAFEACEFVVDETKRRVPIWKKEHYVDGATDWLHADGRRAITPEAFFARQVRVPEIGSAGQERLGASRVLVVGAGGLGSPALTYLAATGVGTITIVDGDTVEPSNLHRQPLYGWADVGRPKARLAAERLHRLNPFVQINVVAERLTEGNVEELVASHDLVLDGTDNFATKLLLNDVCLANAKPLVVASIHRWDGQIVVVAPQGPCLRCLWPTPPPDGCVGTCADDGVLGAVPGVFGSLQAIEAVKSLVEMPTTAGSVVLFDLRTLSTESFRLPKDPACPSCGAEPKSWRELRRAEGEVLPTDAREDYLLVDIREPDEVAEQAIPGAFLMPLSVFDANALPHAEQVLLVCRSGARSGKLMRRLRDAGDPRFFTLVGGLGALARA